MKPEPLKEKKFWAWSIEKEHTHYEYEVILWEDLKQTVQGLLKDLKKMHEENLKDLIWKIGNPPTLWYEDVVDLIKKRFGDFDEKD